MSKELEPSKEENQEVQATAAAQQSQKGYDRYTATAVKVLWSLAVGSYLAASLYAPEFYEQLVLGRWIISHRALPREDYWTLLAGNHKWVPVSWLFSVSLAAVESFLGELGLALVKLIFFLLFVSTAAHFFSVQARESFFGTSIAFITSCALLLDAPLSPELLAWSLFAACLGVFYSFSKPGASTKPRLIVLFAVGVIYANVHGSSLLILGVILIFSSAAFGELGKSRRELLPAAGVLALGQVCTPYLGMQVIQVLHTAVNQLSLDLYYQRSAGTVFDFPVAFLLLILLLLALFWSKSPKSLRTSEAVVLSFFIVLGLASSFVLPYALILAGFLTATLWGRSNSKDLGELALGFDHLRHKLSRLSSFGVLWIAICIIIVNVVNIYRIPSSKAFLPQAEIDYILESKLPFPILHESSIGPYLVYRFSNARGEAVHKAALTPRAMALAPEVGRYGIVLDMLSSGWQKFFDYIGPNTVLCRKASAMYAVLQSDPAWKLVFENEAALNSVSQSEVSRRIPDEYIWAVFLRQEGGIGS